MLISGIMPTFSSWPLGEIHEFRSSALDPFQFLTKIQQPLVTFGFAYKQLAARIAADIKV